MTLIPELRAIVGDRHVVDGTTALLSYASDALPGYRKIPSVAVFPGTRDEIVSVVRHLALRGLPFVPRGAGTGLSGGALADGVVLLGLQRLKRILAVDPIARTAVVEPGVVNASLTAAAAPHGLHYAPDPSSQTACTIGGNVAENAGGPHCLKYGVTLNHIVAATVVLPNGEIVPLRVPQDLADGYDLLGAFVGSEGCFGVALEITVRLTPNPAAIRTLLADFLSLADAARTVSAIVASGVVPAACELIDQGTIRAVEASIYAAGYPTDAAAVLLVEVDGPVPAVEEEAAHVERIFREHGARSVRSAADPVDRARLWQGRKKAFGAMGRVAPNLVVQDAVVPRTQLAEILAAIAEIGRRNDVRICNVFHAGDGNLHPNIPYNGRDPVETERVHAAMGEIMQTCIAAGGTITGEHGVGLDKLPYMEQLFTPDTLDAMCRLRSAFDSARRSNPGKTVPVRACREWSGVANTKKKTTEHAEKTLTSTDPSALVRVPSASSVVSVISVVSELVDTINAAREAGTQLYISGARTQITHPPAGATTVDVRRHASVIEYVPADLTITVGAGITLDELNAITAENNQWCPLLPWGSDDGTLGGVLATGLRGPASNALGSPRDLALGLTFVDGRGAVVSAGGRVVKNVAGFDLTRTLIGSYGTLGVITSASLRLRARPPVMETWAFPVLATDPDAVAALLRGPVAPAACERVPRALAVTLGLSDESHFMVLLAGGAAHVGTSRSAFRGAGPASPLANDVWRTLRAVGPFSDVPQARPVPAALASLNERVRHAFDPDSVFAYPVGYMRPAGVAELSHV